MRIVQVNVLKVQTPYMEIDLSLFSVTLKSEVGQVERPTVCVTEYKGI